MSSFGIRRKRLELAIVVKSSWSAKFYVLVNVLNANQNDEVQDDIFVNFT